MTSLARVTRSLLVTGGRRYSSRMAESTTRDSDERPSLFWRMMAPFQSLTGMVFNRSVSSSPVIHGKCGVLKDGEHPKDLSETEWKARLDPEQYEITRGKGTERAFTGKYYYHHEKGTYACSCCGVPLFSSSTKYESGSGWPSFYEALRDPGLDESASNVKRHTDMSHGMVRTEVTCKQCDAHLGHVFPDGPKETGERFCINSASLAFDPGCGESKM